MIQTIAEALNLQLMVGTPTDGGKWGEFTNASATNIYSGLFGDIAKRITDIGFGDFFIKLHQLEDADFSLPHRMESICYLVWCRTNVG